MHAILNRTGAGASLNRVYQKDNAPSERCGDKSLARFLFHLFSKLLIFFNRLFRFVDVLFQMLEDFFL